MDVPQDFYCTLPEFYATYEHTGLAVVVLDRAGRVHAVSPSARRLLAENKDIGDGHLKSSIEAVVSRALRRRRVPENNNTVSRLVLRPLGREAPLFVFLTQIELIGPWPSSTIHALLMLIRDPSQVLSTEHVALMELYGLTRKESHLATYLAAGHDIAGFAAERFISPYTVKSHLKQIFRKMNVHNQAQLVALVLALVH